jgi:UDP-3-O-[3-hydroxymyristoyl] glucosamine N-acyltransferase
MAIFIHPSADVHPDAKIGDGTKIWNNAQIRATSVIGKNCVIGKDVYVDVGVIIGNNVKIQNYVDVCDGVILEDNVFIGPTVCFFNDLYPRSDPSGWTLVKVLVREGCSIGGNSGIVGGIELGRYSMIAAGSLVSNNVLPFSLVKGNPARMVGFVCKKGHPMKTIQLGHTTIYHCSICNKKLTLNIQVEED